MSIFSYHLVRVPFHTGLKNMFLPWKTKNIPGLIYSEPMTAMTLGSAILSTERVLVREFVFFAQWEDESAIDRFLKEHHTGKILARGWHTRLKFLRQWGSFSGFEIPNETIENEPKDTPIVAVTIARMKFLEIPRFINWGRPVEKLVRDHPGTTLSLASLKLPHTVSTFSVWKSLKEMTNMVSGHSDVPQPKRHKNAMKERERKDFHYEFTTLRFKPISEYGQWNGRKNIIPLLNTKN